MPESESSGSAARIREVFSRALESPPGPDREQFLDSACGSDPVLKKEVESLLQSHVETGTFLDTSASGRAIASQDGIVGTQIGRYRIIESIGEGGFGEVYRAEQTEPMHREVALKIIKPGMDSREVIARFESERQALALMDHPNIAHVFDAGTTEGGRLYFVMELVCGVPITVYCDDHQLELPVRLKLFQQVCGAVQHAHQKGIIHRDLKPSNIVVIERDGFPVPKIIDFGIAKSLQGRLSDRIMVTQREVFIGTPA